MRVLQAMAGATHGGAEAFFERLVAAFARAGITQHVLMRRDAPRAQRLQAAGIVPVELAFGGPLDLFTQHRFRFEAESFHPDIMLTWMSRATAAAPRGDWIHIGRLGGYYDLKYYRRCDELIGNTPDIVAYMTKSAWPAAHAHYVPNFVSVPDAAPESRAAHATPEGVPLLLALGRLHPNKAFDTLLRALALVPGACLWLAGEGPEEARLKLLASELGLTDRVRFLGWREDISALFGAADIMVCPSRHEPLGNVVLEAFAVRKPVVAARAQGPAALIDDGQNGLLAPVDDAPALAAAIGRLIADPALAQSLAAAGYELWRERYCEPVVIQRYLTLFASLKESRAPKRRNLVG